MRFDFCNAGNQRQDGCGSQFSNVTGKYIPGTQLPFSSFLCMERIDERSERTVQAVRAMVRRDRLLHQERQLSQEAFRHSQETLHAMYEEELQKLRHRCSEAVQERQKESVMVRTLRRQLDRYEESRRTAVSTATCTREDGLQMEPYPRCREIPPVSWCVTPTHSSPSTDRDFHVAVHPHHRHCRHHRETDCQVALIVAALGSFTALWRVRPLMVPSSAPAAPSTAGAWEDCLAILVAHNHYDDGYDGTTTSPPPPSPWIEWERIHHREMEQSAQRFTFQFGAVKDESSFHHALCCAILRQVDRDTYKEDDDDLLPQQEKEEEKPLPFLRLFTQWTSCSVKQVDSIGEGMREWGNDDGAPRLILLSTTARIDGTGGGELRAVAWSCSLVGPSPLLFVSQWNREGVLEQSWTRASDWWGTVSGEEERYYQWHVIRGLWGPSTSSPIADRHEETWLTCDFIDGQGTSFSILNDAESTEAMVMVGHHSHDNDRKISMIDLQPISLIPTGDSLSLRAPLLENGRYTVVLLVAKLRMTSEDVHRADRYGFLPALRLTLPTVLEGSGTFRPVFGGTSAPTAHVCLVNGEEHLLSFSFCCSSAAASSPTIPTGTVRFADGASTTDDLTSLVDAAVQHSDLLAEENALRWASRITEHVALDWAGRSMEALFDEISALLAAQHHQQQQTHERWRCSTQFLESFEKIGAETAAALWADACRTLQSSLTLRLPPLSLPQTPLPMMFRSVSTQAAASCTDRSVSPNEQHTMYVAELEAHASLLESRVSQLMEETVELADERQLVLEELQASETRCEGLTAQLREYEMTLMEKDRLIQELRNRMI